MSHVYGVYRIKTAKNVDVANPNDRWSMLALNVLLVAV